MDCKLCAWIWLDNCWWLGQVTALRCGQGQQMRNYVEWDWDVLCRQRGTNGSRGQCEQVNKCQSGRAEHRLIGAAWIAVMRNAGIQWSTEHYHALLPASLVSFRPLSPPVTSESLSALNRLAVAVIRPSSIIHLGDVLRMRLGELGDYPWLWANYPHLVSISGSRHGEAHPCYPYKVMPSSGSEYSQIIVFQTTEVIYSFLSSFIRFRDLLLHIHM